MHNKLLIISLALDFTIQEASSETALSLLAWISIQQETALLSRGVRGWACLFIYLFTSSSFLSLHHRGYVLSFKTSVLSNVTQRKFIWQLHLDLFAGVLWKQIPRSALASMPPLHRISVLRDYWVARSHQQHQTKDFCLFPTRGDNPVHSLLCGNHSLVDKLIKS